MLFNELTLRRNDTSLELSNGAKTHMKKTVFFSLTIALAGLLTSGSVWSHNRYSFGFNLGYYNPGYYGGFGYRNYGYGYPYFYPPLYSYPSYYAPVVVVPSEPPVYIQKETTRPIQAPDYVWYYCRNPEGYYPYVKQCSEGWLQVAPQPATQ